MSALTTFAETAIELHRGGYRPIPLRAETKIPSVGGWNELNDRPWELYEVENAVCALPDEACGIAVQKTLCAVDVDILDDAIASQVSEIRDAVLGKTPLVRIGMAPKSLTIFRSDGTTRSRKPHPIEIFSGSGQVALFGSHARAGRPYLWPDKSPMNLAINDAEIPIVSGALIDTFLAEAAPILAPLRQARRTNSTGGGSFDWFERASELQVMGLDWLEITKMITADAMRSGLGRHDAVWTTANIACRAGRTSDEYLTVLRFYAPGLIEYVDAADNYTDRTLDRIFGE